MHTLSDEATIMTLFWLTTGAGAGGIESTGADIIREDSKIEVDTEEALSYVIHHSSRL